MIANYKNLTQKEYLLKLFNIFDCMQVDDSKRTTPTEKEFLVEILMLPKQYDYFKFSHQAKKYIINKIKDETGMEHSFQNLNNKTYNLIRKGYLWKDEDAQIYFKPFIIKAIHNLEKALKNNQPYDFVFRFKQD